MGREKEKRLMAEVWFVELLGLATNFKMCLLSRRNAPIANNMAENIAFCVLETLLQASPTH